MKEIPKAYEPEKFEDSIYENWEKSGYFRPEINMGKNPSYDRKKDGKPFVIMMPPPNVTGKLHIGHSLFITLEDIMTRFNRMRGKPALWLPGLDHAGIATQSVVEKALRKEGIDKNKLGREKFTKKIWEWKEQYGGIILKQMRKMGASCDWSRERFTLDEGLNKSVNEAFVSLYNKGLIYQGEYIVNWCPRCHTAISDDEVEHEEQKTKLYYFRYDKNFPITIATTRPETKLGDVAIAVNPKDKRYKKYIGKELKVDIDGVERMIKIIGDRAIDEKFGTGAVGVTPAHSMIDWRMAEDNKLPVIKVIDENGRMTENAGEYAGLKTKEASEKLIKYLKDNNLLKKEEDYLNNISVCYRCGSAIEPLPSKQWFVRMKPLAEKARKAVESGEIEIIPKRFEKVYFHWLDNIRDWCISRQLWWGHQIPVYYKQVNIKDQISNIKKKEQEIYVGLEPPEGEDWVQDSDVLDTWFSSGLWPFSTLGWPDTTSKDYQYFYPTNVMETGYDLLFFWVSRMIMMGLELTGEAPFKTIYLHGLVRDEHNRKMSKSKGNALDPLDLIPKYGTDALRMALVVGQTPGQDVALGESKIKGYRNFSNKIWNASRFVLLRVSEGDLQTGEIGNAAVSDMTIDKSILTEPDKKILKLHEEVKESISKKIELFKFSSAGEELYEYFWHQFCDIYIEAAKEQLNVNSKEQETNNKQIPNSKFQNSEKIAENTKKILITVLSENLLMMHPFIPFVTEAVWQELRKIYSDLPESIMIAKWPRS